MRLPRRTPWAHLSELDEVCGWIYGSESTLESKVAAVNRLAAWRMNTALPHSLESTLSLLQVIVDDTMSSSIDDSSRVRMGFRAVRQAYAMAIVRLVNGLVDPLQQGMYARPIASIAAQIGLPGWFIELRHAATHEDLPSLQVLRESAKEALNWLLHNYWIPTLNGPSSSVATNRGIPLSPLGPLLKEYKSLMKLSVRDASLQEQHKPELARLFRTLERWISEAKVAAGLDPVVANDEGGEDDDWRERWALEKVCLALMDKGGLVPVSKKKRSQNSDDELELPPNRALWIPLLTQLQETHPSFASQLLGQFVNYFGVPSESVDRSYESCIAGWTIWVVETWHHLPDCNPREIISGLLLGVVGRETHALKLLIRKLSVREPSVGFKAEILLSVIEQGKCAAQMGSGEDMIEEMEKRMDILERVSEGTKEDNSENTQMDIGPGWRVLDLQEWKPCPLGMF